MATVSSPSLEDFFNLNTSDLSLKEEIFRSVDQYHYSQYKNYPSTRKDSWKELHKYVLENLFENREWRFHYEKINDVPFLLGCRFSKWDSEHFGFGVAFLSLLLGGSIDDQNSLDKIIRKCIGVLKKSNVRFVSARIHGDFIEAIHSFENNGFRYFENIIWPVADVRDRNLTCSDEVRMIRPDELSDIVKLGVEHIYKRGHYHCDKNLDIKSVNALYGRLVTSSWDRKDSFVVIEEDNLIKGFFIFRWDETLSRITGYKYARMYSLALNSDSRGKGMGKQLFEGMMALAQDKGAEMIDSGYSSKNHASARLHSTFGFYSVYEEITMHTWLNP
jgi:L-amino acid N-acyltransferase YncA